MRIYTRRPDELKVGQHVKDESTGASFFVTFVGSHYIDLLPIANGGNCAEIIEACQELDTLTKRDGETALEKFRRMESECQDLIDEIPIERLRFFVSLMCDINQDSQSWSDIEFLFDECTNNSTMPRYEPEGK